MLHVCIPILMGLIIYALFRPNSLLLSHWLINMNINIYGLINQLQANVHFLPPAILLYNMPDALWMYSFTSLMIILWDNKLSSISAFWILLVPFAGILTEAGQFFNIIPGTFDILDLLFLIIASVLPFILIKVTIQKNAHLITTK